MSYPEKSKYTVEDCIGILEVGTQEEKNKLIKDLEVEYFRENPESPIVKMTKGKEHGWRRLVSLSNYIEDDVSRYTLLKMMTLTALEEGNVGMYKVLTEINEEYKEKNPLLYAGSPEVVLWLVEQGYNVDGEYKKEEKPLHSAVRKGKIDVVKTLIDLGAKVDSVDCCGNTSLGLAAKRGDLEIMKELMEGDANVEGCESEGTSPLEEAVRENHYDAAKLLLEKGANPKRKLSFGRKAIYYASSGEMRKLLKEAIEKKNEEKFGNMMSTPKQIEPENKLDTQKQIESESGMDAPKKIDMKSERRDSKRTKKKKLNGFPVTICNWDK